MLTFPLAQSMCHSNSGKADEKSSTIRIAASLSISISWQVSMTSAIFPTSSRVIHFSALRNNDYWPGWPHPSKTGSCYPHTPRCCAGGVRGCRDVRNCWPPWRPKARTPSDERARGFFGSENIPRQHVLEGTGRARFASGTLLEMTLLPLSMPSNGFSRARAEMLGNRCGENTRGRMMRCSVRVRPEKHEAVFR
jgi:hypothetical protein